jgi:glycosyltransferase involved in cell wall biosynthesis
LKIGLNATCFNDRPSGAKQRFVGIYGELFKRLPHSQFIIYEPDDCRVGSWFGNLANVSVKRTPVPSEGRASKFFFGLSYWGAELARENFDFFEVFNLPLIKAPTGKTVLTIHDIRGMLPESGLLQNVAYKLFLRRSLIAAHHVITVSESMKKEIHDFFPELPVSVIYNGTCEPDFSGVSNLELNAICFKYSLPEKFILAVGHFELRKNYLRLIEAIAELRDNGLTVGLVIVGNNSGERHILEQQATRLNLLESVKFLSGLSDLEIRCVYKLCELFVFPSSYEGFGIPILEAMSAKRPMVLSDIPVFREITEGRSFYFDHVDVKAMAKAIETVLTSSAERERQVEYGCIRVRNFSFSSLAAQIEHLYKTLQ